MKTAFRFQTLRWLVFCLPLFIVGCDDDDADSILGIVVAVFDLVVNIVDLAD
ncbi:MAG: hypothetical protein MI923_20685 [Phycisphaerales bacterium]|nr:hypothetical protein [Phycisphaerales bacterium]